MTEQTDAVGAQIKCPHCGYGLLWSEDRGPHCDGCDDFNATGERPETRSEDA